MAKVNITIECRFGNALSALSDASKSWPPEKLEAFSDEWDRLAFSGAEMMEHKSLGGRVVAYPSEDFTLHLEKWGVNLW